jgi:hypothetical protein
MLLCVSLSGLSAFSKQSLQPMSCKVAEKRSFHPWKRAVLSWRTRDSSFTNGTRLGVGLGAVDILRSGGSAGGAITC